MSRRDWIKNSNNKTSFKISGTVGVIILLLGMAILFGVNQMNQVNQEINELEYLRQDYQKQIQQDVADSVSEIQNDPQIIMIDEISKVIYDSTERIEQNETNYLAGQIVIIGLVGVMAALLGHFLGQINKDLQIQVKRKTKELQKANEKLKLLDKRKDEFIGIASHELKSPIQPIFGFAELAKAGDIDQKEAWEGVTQLAKQLQDLANDVLDVNRIENNRLALDKEKLSLNDLILNCTHSLKINLEKSITIDEKLDEDQEIEVDRIRMEQVLRNLLNNAIKFTSKGTITVSTISSEDSHVIIKVADSGRGIPKDFLPKIFEKFVTKSYERDNKGGTGLGLFLCKGIVEAHGGKIHAYNNKDLGATFEFTIPIEKKQFQNSISLKSQEGKERS